MAPSFVTVGSITLDWVISAEGELNLEGCGGAVLFAAAGAHLWSDSVAVVSRVGNDYPSKYLADFQDNGVDMSAIKIVNEPHLQVSAIEYEANGDRHSFDPDQVSAARGITFPDVLRANVAPEDAGSNCEEVSNLNPNTNDLDGDFWHAKGFHLAPVPHVVQNAFASRLNEEGILFTLDPGLDCEKQEFFRFLREVPILLPSEKEFGQIFEAKDSEAAVGRFAGLGPRVVVIKMGRAGSLVCDTRTGVRRSIPVFPTNAKDPTGAGDAFGGGFLVGYSETGDPFEAALRATISASFIIEDFDARYALKFGRKDAEARLKQLRALAI